LRYVLNANKSYGEKVLKKNSVLSIIILSFVGIHPSILHAQQNKIRFHIQLQNSWSKK